MESTKAITPTGSQDAFYCRGHSRVVKAAERRFSVGDSRRDGAGFVWARRQGWHIGVRVASNIRFSDRVAPRRAGTLPLLAGPDRADRDENSTAVPRPDIGHRNVAGVPTRLSRLVRQPATIARAAQNRMWRTEPPSFVPGCQNRPGLAAICSPDRCLTLIPRCRRIWRTITVMRQGTANNGPGNAADPGKPQSPPIIKSVCGADPDKWGALTHDALGRKLRPMACPGRSCLGLSWSVACAGEPGGGRRKGMASRRASNRDGSRCQPNAWLAREIVWARGGPGSRCRRQAAS